MTLLLVEQELQLQELDMLHTQHPCLQNATTLDGNQKSGKLTSRGWVVYPIICRVFLHPKGGAGFLPSTVSTIFLNFGTKEQRSTSHKELITNSS